MDVAVRGESPLSVLGYKIARGTFVQVAVVVDNNGIFFVGITVWHCKVVRWIDKQASLFKCAFNLRYLLFCLFRISSVILPYALESEVQQFFFVRSEGLGSLTVHR